MTRLKKYSVFILIAGGIGAGANLQLSADTLSRDEHLTSKRASPQAPHGQGLQKQEPLGQAAREQGPHGGQQIRKDQDRYEVLFNSKDPNVEIYALDQKEQTAPKRLTLYVSKSKAGKTGEPKQIQLRLIDAREGIPHYAGTIDLSLASAIAIGVSFDLG